MNKEKELIDKLIDLAFAEDIGDGDHTTPVSYTHLKSHLLGIEISNGKVKFILIGPLSEKKF